MSLEASQQVIQVHPEPGYNATAEELLDHYQEAAQ